MDKKKLVLASLGALGLLTSVLSQCPKPQRHASTTAPPTTSPPPAATTAPALAPPAPRPLDAATSSTRAAAPRPAPFIEAAWGSAPGQLGHRTANESNPEAPAAILSDGDDLLVLDQVNGRVQRFRRGVAIGSFPVSETVQDLALAPGGRTVLLDRLSDKSVTIVGADGSVISEIPLAGRGLDDPSAATGVFADEGGVYVEREHGSLVRVAGADGAPDDARPELPGRPTRDGERLLTAAIADAALGRAILTAFERSTLELGFAADARFSRPILQLVLLDSDARGNVYLGAEGAREREDHTSYDAAIMVLRFDARGQQTGAVELPAGTTGDETVRPITVGDDGALYVMTPGPSGLVVSRVAFP